MDGRVDYVRILMTGDTIQRAQDASYYDSLGMWVVQKFALEGKPYETKPHFDRPTKSWISFFNIWGEAADKFFDALPVEYFKNVTRLDYRFPVLNDALDLEQIGLDAYRRLNKQNTITFHNSKVKSKRGGRDTGGKTITVGGKDSPRRIALYQRAKEQPALEIQLNGSILQGPKTKAYSEHEANQTSFHLNLKAELHKELSRMSESHLRLPLDALEEGGQLPEQFTLFASQEDTLQQMDLLWELLEPDAKSAFFESRALDEANVVPTYSTELDYDEWKREQNLTIRTDDEARRYAKEWYKQYQAGQERESEADDEGYIPEDHELPW